MAREIVHTGRRIQVAIDTFVAPDGRSVRRDLILHPGAVVILPILDDGNVLLIRNHRYSVQQVLIELPAGTLERVKIR